jgi:hypothetical protein
MSERGIRNNEGKPRWGFMDFKAMEPMIKVLEQFGDQPGSENWKKGLLTVEICESLIRHVAAYLSGEDNDPKSKEPHVGHILSNAMFLSHMHLFRPDMDNRGKKEGKVVEKTVLTTQGVLHAKVGDRYPAYEETYWEYRDRIKQENL